jgi:phage/plasmid-like protein (TIGR03299 family)
MAHGIMKNVDKGIVGLCEVYGGTWHSLKEYEQVNGPVPFDDVVKAIGYTVEKRQLHVTNVNPDGTTTMVPTPDMFALVRTDSQIPVHKISVSDEFEVYQNVDFLNEMQSGILKSNPDLQIESCGSLWGGKIAFVNFLLKTYRVKGDTSDTLSRLMYYNAFGGRSISATAHETRVVCFNTLLRSEAQGLANQTLRKFKHTSGAPKRVGEYMVDLSQLMISTEKHKAVLDHLAEQQMQVREVEHFLGHMFEIEEGDSKKTQATRVNKRGEILKIFESGVDLQGAIARTRYAMLQSVTAYSQHETLSKDMDETSTWFDVVSGGGRHKFNQKAFSILTQDEIPVPAGCVAVSDLVDASAFN